MTREEDYQSIGIGRNIKHYSVVVDVGGMSWGYVFGYALAHMFLPVLLIASRLLRRRISV